MHKVLKDESYLVVTFHNKEMKEWNDFVSAVRSAGFKFEKVTHQYNKRSGESNVSNPYGTSGSDFYIRCKKQSSDIFKSEASELKHFILVKTIDIVAQRGEPTPYDFIINGVLPELLQSGYIEPEKPAIAVDEVLKNNIGEDKIFKVENNKESNAGKILWFNEPSKHINYPDIPLSDRVEETVLSILRNKISVKFDYVIAQLFKMYPNGLTPDPRKIRNVLEKYAFTDSGKWKLKDLVKEEMTEHTKIINQLCKIGKKLKYKVFIGKREQPEPIDGGKKLGDNSDFKNLEILQDSYGKEKIDRISMIDCLYLEGSSIKCIFEVENSTNFSSAILRASNMSKEISKFMVIPDKREDELKRFNDPLFKSSFKEYSWKYITYSNIDCIYKIAKPKIESIYNKSENII